MDESLLINAIEKQKEVGLIYGKLGIAIYSFYNDTLYRSVFNTSFGEKLVTEVHAMIHDEMVLNIANGLSGIGIGIDYLVKNGFVSGNIDDILEEIDDLLFKKIMYDSKEEEMDLFLLIEILLYLSFRYENGLKKKVNRSILEDFIIKIINTVYINRTEKLYEEPIPFSLFNFLAFYLIALARFHKMGFYRFRIEKILEEMEVFLFSRIPFFHANRLTMLYAVRSVYNITHKKEWAKYACLLKNQLSVDMILSHEMKDKNVFLLNGISGVYVLLCLYNHENEDPIEIDYAQFYNRISSSLVWSDFESDPEVLKKKINLDGYFGIKMILAHIQSKIK